MKKSRQKIQPKNGYLISVTRKDTRNTESTSIIIECHDKAHLYALRLLSSGKYLSTSMLPV